MGSFSIVHWLLVLAVVVLVFGTKKLKNLGSDIGGAVKGFKDAMKDASDPASSTEPQPQVTAKPLADAANTIDVQAKTKA